MPNRTRPRSALTHDRRQRSLLAVGREFASTRASSSILQSTGAHAMPTEAPAKTVQTAPVCATIVDSSMGGARHSAAT